MFRRMLKGALTRQKRKLVMIALTMALGVSLATAMLNVMMDVGDKVNQELKAYGANLKLMPRQSSLLADIYELEETDKAGYMDEGDLLKIKTIFWAHNIVDFAPFLEAKVTVNGREATIVGTWFDKHLDLPTGEYVDTGVAGLKSWWDVQGEWLADEDAASVMLGERLAARLGTGIGDAVEIAGIDGTGGIYTVKSIVSSGGPEDDEIFVALPVAQRLSANEGKVHYVDISALTTPENDLARKAAQDPRSLSVSEWDLWYCTAYISSIAYQLEEALPDARAKAVLQVAESEGAILQKIQLLMLLLTVLSLLCAALGISNLVTANVMERSSELGLLKALGASDTAISLLMLAEILVTAVIGGIIGYFLGLGFAQIIGQTVFSASVSPKGVVVPVVCLLVLLVTLLGSVPALRMLLSLRPTQVLHGR